MQSDATSTFRSSTLRLVAGLGLFCFGGLFAAACDGDDGTGPNEPDADQEVAELAYTIQPSTTTAGQTINPSVKVEARNAQGNTVKTFTGNVTISLATDPTDGNASLSGTSTKAASEGVATFDDLSLMTAATGYTLSARSTGISPVESQVFEVTPDSPAQLAYLTQPSDTEGQEPISPSIEVAVQDQFGNRVTSSTANVTLGFGNNPTGDDMADKTAPVSNGVATFSDRRIDLPEDGYTLQASSNGLPSVESEPFSIFLTFTQVSTGGSLDPGGVPGQDRTCGVTAANHAYCWGIDPLGTDELSTSPTPVPVKGNLSFAQIDVGLVNVCAVTTDNEAYCWGANGRSQIGNTSITVNGSETPVLVEGGHQFREVSVGAKFACGLTTSDEALCWGKNAWGQLGDGTETGRATPTSVAGGISFAEISAGGRHTCGIATDDTLYCWGRNLHHQLGDGTDTRRRTPNPVSGDLSSLQVSAGSFHTCVATTSNEAYCWGTNEDGQVGDGTTSGRFNGPSTPQLVSGDLTVAQVDAGARHTCAVTTTSEGFCWGYNANGELGDGTTSRQLTPTPVSGSLTHQLIAAAPAHTCSLTQDGVYCWGFNGNGALGDGTNADRILPTEVVH